MSAEPMSVEELRDILENGRDMLRIPVKGVPGLFIVRWPAMLGSPAHLALEVNPLKEDGTMWREIGYLVFNRLTLEDLRKSYIKEVERLELLLDERLDSMVEVVERLNEGGPIPPDYYPEDLIGAPVGGLRWMLERGKDWVRLPTRVPGVFIVKVRVTKDAPAYLAVELNPLDEGGRPSYGLGYLLSTMDDLERYRTKYYTESFEGVDAFLRILYHPGIDELAEKLEEVNPGWLKNWRWGYKPEG